MSCCQELVIELVIRGDPLPPRFDVSAYPRFKDFYSALQSKPMLRFIESEVNFLIERYGAEYIGFAEYILEKAEAMNWDAMKAVVSGYYSARISRGERNIEGNERLYSDDEFMENKYYAEILMFYTFSTIQYSDRHFFYTKFLPKIKDGSCGVDIGFGEGLLLLETCRNVSGVNLSGFDISQAAIEVASNLLKTEAFSAKLYTGNILDGLPLPQASQDFAVCAHVLGKLPQPDKALAEIARIIRPEGLFFVTCRINSPSKYCDDISRGLTDAGSVVMLIRNSGFEIIEQLMCRYQEGVAANQKHCSYAFVCKRIS